MSFEAKGKIAEIGFISLNTIIILRIWSHLYHQRHPIGHFKDTRFRRYVTGNSCPVNSHS